MKGVYSENYETLRRETETGEKKKVRPSILVAGRINTKISKLPNQYIDSIKVKIPVMQFT